MAYILEYAQERYFRVIWGYLGAIFCLWRLLSQWRTGRDQKFHFWDGEKILKGMKAQTYMTSLVGL